MAASGRSLDKTRVTIVDRLALFRVTKRFCISCGQRSCSGNTTDLTEQYEGRQERGVVWG